MRRIAAALAVTGLLTGTMPVSAVTNAQKMETCKFGADDQKLEGAKRKAFMAKCMSKKNDARGTPEKK